MFNGTTKLSGNLCGNITGISDVIPIFVSQFKWRESVGASDNYSFLRKGQGFRYGVSAELPDYS
jgi:hypothetical protein